MSKIYLEVTDVNYLHTIIIEMSKLKCQIKSILYAIIDLII